MASTQRLYTVSYFNGQRLASAYTLATDATDAASQFCDPFRVRLVGTGAHLDTCGCYDCTPSRRGVTR